MLTLHCPPENVHALASFLRENGAEAVSVAALDYVYTRDNPLYAKLAAELESAPSAASMHLDSRKANNFGPSGAVRRDQFTKSARRIRNGNIADLASCALNAGSATLALTAALSLAKSPAGSPSAR